MPSDQFLWYTLKYTLAILKTIAGYTREIGSWVLACCKHFMCIVNDELNESLFLQQCKFYVIHLYKPHLLCIQSQSLSFLFFFLIVLLLHKKIFLFDVVLKLNWYLRYFFSQSFFKSILILSFLLLAMNIARYA